MKLFRLPDLGEGLPDGIIREWYVKVGDQVQHEQPIVAMETAKALVDVPAPFSGTVEKLFGEAGDTIDTGQPLIGFVGEDTVANNTDAGTVVGTLETSESTTDSTDTTPPENHTQSNDQQKIQVTPALRFLAKQLNVDLHTVKSKGKKITAEDIKYAAAITDKKPTHTLTGNTTPLSSVRRSMAIAMAKAHQFIVPATIMDDANVSAWETKQDISLRILRALTSACEAVPLLNCHFDSSQMAYQLNDAIHVGLAIDSPNGLYVPVLKDIANQSNQQLRKKINHFKHQVQEHSIAASDLKGATIMLSNIGAIFGQYAAPVILPPMVAIVVTGRIKVRAQLQNNQVVNQQFMPISITFDHRPITGGDAARFLQAMINHLQQPSLEPNVSTQQT